jgi:hypothetical protein
MSYQNLLIQNTNTKVLVKENMYGAIHSSLENIVIVYKLLDYRVDIVVGGTRFVKISFHKDSSDNFQIQLQKMQGKLHSIDVYFPSSKKERLVGLFGKDMDLVLDCSGHNVKLFSYIDTGMLKILRKIPSL